MHSLGWLEQPQPSSTWQTTEQPSPLPGVPSSQDSPPSITPFPHTTRGTTTDGEAPVGWETTSRYKPTMASYAWPTIGNSKDWKTVRPYKPAKGYDCARKKKAEVTTTENKTTKTKNSLLKPIH
ncbi:MAG TPA: hypothetical protein ACFYD4_10380 [Candidatus Wunengus sp. YC61]|uniref:hypothetical protein n=1 Tax=Candidatus Wunengus sp. YC61 TaxID=3367698 RepID=UPI00402863BD